MKSYLKMPRPWFDLSNFALIVVLGWSLYSVCRLRLHFSADRRKTEERIQSAFKGIEDTWTKNEDDWNRYVLLLERTISDGEATHMQQARDLCNEYFRFAQRLQSNVSLWRSNLNDSVSPSTTNDFRISDCAEQLLSLAQEGLTNGLVIKTFSETNQLRQFTWGPRLDAATIASFQPQADESGTPGRDIPYGLTLAIVLIAAIQSAAIYRRVLEKSRPRLNVSSIVSWSAPAVAEPSPPEIHEPIESLHQAYSSAASFKQPPAPQTDSPEILIVEDDAAVAGSLKRVLEMEGYEVTTTATAAEGLAIIQKGDFQVVITDWNLQTPDASGMDVLKTLSETRPHLPVVLVTGEHTADKAIEATRLGAYDYIIKSPHMAEDLLGLLKRAVATSRLMSEPVAIGEAQGAKHAIVGDSRSMQHVYKQIGRVAATPVTVLILGEIGTGKELVARAVYQHSNRADQPFIEVNCVAVPENILESELFGHEAGAFNDANLRRIGRFEQADHGTIFLDEIGDMSLNTQAKLLRLLQERRIQRLGSEELVQVDVRVITTTNCDLGEAIREKRFREDLYHRLNEAVIHLPPLRERTDDILQLVRYFIRRHATELHTRIPALVPESEVIERLCKHSWPGNVRELENLIRNALLAARGDAITPGVINELLQGTNPSSPGPDTKDSQPVSTVSASASGTPVIADYQLLRIIGEGGFGTVWLAQTVIGAFCAVKIIRRGRFGNDETFRREFSALKDFASLSSHEGLVDILHVGRNEEQRFYYYVMELADDAKRGRNFGSDIYEARTLKWEIEDRGRLPVYESLGIGMMLATTLARLHQGGHVHRDIKPSNIIFVKGQPKLADIGLIAAIGGISRVGTEPYIPPEGPGKAQADIYALGKVLFEMSSGRNGFEYPAPPQPFQDPKEWESYLALEKIVLKACHNDINQRYRKASELAAELNSLLDRLRTGV
jgi:DNA-binding NtrC family response regulator